MTFREALVRFVPRFSGSDQQDSQEFLLFLLDGLHEDLNSTAFGRTQIHSSLVDDLTFEKLPDWQASALSWEKYLHKNSSIIVSLFQGQYRSRLTCLSCKQVSEIHKIKRLRKCLTFFFRHLQHIMSLCRCHYRSLLKN